MREYQKGALRPTAVVDTCGGEGNTWLSGEGVLHVVEPEW